MDVASVLQEVSSWPVEDRIRLVETVWDQLVDQGVEPELTDAQKAVLDRRMAELAANPKIGIPWEDVQAHIRRQR